MKKKEKILVKLGRMAWITAGCLMLGVLPTRAAGLNDTGQTLCYDANGATISCAGSGQDGQYGRDPAFAASQFAKTGAGAAGFDFTRVCMNGDLEGDPAGICTGTLVQGAAANQWACTKDNVTNLTWEVKTTSGLRSNANTYTWYSTDAASNGGYAGTANGGTCTDSNCDTQSFVDAVNALNAGTGLCSHKDWRLPSQRELLTLVYASGSSPSIDPTYFPNTPASYFWSGSSYVRSPVLAWVVLFGNGITYAHDKTGARYVRLVSGGQF